ncbi:hypothetical protein QBC40DRAFT_223960 [Triangularia verruculosa]|uniref:Uncharacterized protein n=1 Tax=Triangularia verruculosa TaxID=2587418 RepID=A0AAN6XIC3_9PEZI|nr:hypothetical protein QBC40DRAFT_223960 [Triangularia verruculosa]
MLSAPVLQLAALGLGALASDCSPYSEVPIWESVESASMESTTVTYTAIKSYSVVPINSWTPNPTSSVWGLAAHTTLETRITARATHKFLAGVVGNQTTNRDVDASLASNDSPIQSGPGDCFGTTRYFNCIYPGDAWQECSSGNWSDIIPVGKVAGIATTCTNFGIHDFLELSNLPGDGVDTPVMTGLCDPVIWTTAGANSKRNIAAGLYNCIWPGFEFQTCSGWHDWTNPWPMQGGIHCNSWGVKTYLSTDEVPGAVSI